ncbi:hypothetical protein [Pseudaminobacter sp. NGMCC 1.201702]|uniref:hypothetical protein n=1 Tax=Pseudaminobacter sp. NGMCC 1.201702 TaxID=3391825 RepID=UPI0039EDF614
MKSIHIQLETPERIALRRLAAEHGLSLERAASTVLREWLIENGYLELAHEFDEETETVGSA